VTRGWKAENGKVTEQWLEMREQRRNSDICSFQLSSYLLMYKIKSKKM